MSTKKLKVHTANYRRRLLEVPRQVGLRIAAEVTSATPVDTGQLRKSWTPSIGSPRFDNSGGSAASVLQGLQLGQVFYFVNGQPYAPRIEYESWSPQAPSGMLGIAVAQLQAITNQVVVEVNRGI